MWILLVVVVVVVLVVLVVVVMVVWLLSVWLCVEVWDEHVFATQQSVGQMQDLKSCVTICE